MKYALFLPLMLPLALHAQGPAPVLAAAVAPVPPQAQAVPAADNCEPIRQQIEARFRAGGVQPVLVVTAVGNPAAGRIVGTCGNGRRQIVRLGQAPLPSAAAATGAAATAPGTDRVADRTADRTGDRMSDRTSDRTPDRAPDREPADRIPTECKDGSIVIGPNCDDPRAVRMTSAELAASLAPARPASADMPAKPASGDLPARPASR